MPAYSLAQSPLALTQAGYVRSVMLITVALPWYRSQAYGRSYDVLSVNLEPSELDGEVCTEGKATSLVGGEAIKLPAYIAARDIPAFIGAALGAEHGTKANGKVD